MRGRILLLGLSIAVAAGLSGCGPEPKETPGETISFATRILKPEGIDPYAGLDEVRLQVLQDGALAAEVTVPFAADWTLPDTGVDPDREIVVKIDGLTGGAVVRTGRTRAVVPRIAKGKTIGIFFSDPAAFAPAPSAPATPRMRAGVATLADGRFLLVGGTTDAGATALDSCELYDPDTGTWSSAGTLPVARMDPAMAVLADGRVLIAGGALAGGAASTAADLWTPPVGTGPGTFAAAAPLPKPWIGAMTAPLGALGKIVLGGGLAGPGALPNEQPIPAVFDPAGTWTELAGGAYAAAASVTAAGGRVLIAGGGDAATFRHADVVSETGGIPSLTAFPNALRVRRYGPTSVAIDANRVLVSGGADAADGVRPTAAFEILDLSGAAPASSFPADRDPHHRSFRPGGRLPDGRILLIGGLGSGTLNLQNSGIVFDPVTGRVESSDSFAEDRSGRGQMTSLSDGTLVSAGSNEASPVVFYNPPLGPLTGIERVDLNVTPRLGTRAAGAVLDGATTLRLRFYDVNSLVDEKTFPPPTEATPLTIPAWLVGNDSLHVTLEALDAGGATLAWGATGTSLNKPRRQSGTLALLVGRVNEFVLGPDPLPSVHGDGAAAYLRGKVAVAGGIGGETATDLYDPTDGTSAALTATLIPVGRRGVRAVVMTNGNPRLLLVGGTTAAGAPVNASSLLTAVNSTNFAWTASANAPATLDHHSLSVQGANEVLAFGNSAGGVPQSQGAVLSGGTWTALPAAPPARSRHQAVKLANGNVLLTGGLVSDGAGGSLITPTAEIYNPVNDSLTPVTGMMATQRRDHVSFALPDGTAVVCGGISAAMVFVGNCERYSPGGGGTWAAAGTLIARDDLVVVRRQDGSFMLVGGALGGAASKTVDVWNVAAGQLQAGPPLVVGRRTASGAALPDGRVVIAGGIDAADLATVEVWTPAAWVSPYAYAPP